MERGGTTSAGIYTGIWRERERNVYLSRIFDRSNDTPSVYLSTNTVAAELEWKINESHPNSSPRLLIKVVGCKKC